MEKSKIPKIPKTKERLEYWLKEHFIIIKEEESRIDDGTFIQKVLVKCPFCKVEFNAIKCVGFLFSFTKPTYCPECRFPKNVIDAFLNLMIKKLKLKLKIP